MASRERGEKCDSTRVSSRLVRVVAVIIKCASKQLNGSTHLDTSPAVGAASENDSLLLTMHTFPKVILPQRPLKGDVSSVSLLVCQDSQRGRDS